MAAATRVQPPPPPSGAMPCCDGDKPCGGPAYHVDPSDEVC